MIDAMLRNVKTMHRPARTHKKLQEARKHVCYEIWMLISTAHILASGTLGKEEVLKNAVMESFVIHTRSLLDFLYPTDRAQDTDILASDFLPPGQWDDERPDKSQLLATAQRRANKEIAHLTYDRLDVTAETKPWKFVEISHEVERVFTVFRKLAKWDVTPSHPRPLPVVSVTSSTMSSTFSEISEAFPFFPPPRP